MNLIVTKFIESANVKPVLQKGHKWASLLHRSGPAMKLYEQFQEEEGTPKRKIPTVRFENLKITFHIFRLFVHVGIRTMRN